MRILPSTFRDARSLLLLLSLSAATSAAMLVNCAPAVDEEEEEPTSEDAITGVNNVLGLALVYDSETSKVKATLKKPLGTGDRLFIRVRRGVIEHDSQAKLDCSQLAEAAPITKGDALVNGKTVYEGPSVSKELVDLLSIYNDERWYGGKETPEMRAEIEKGPDAIVEACVLHGDKVRAKLLTNLAYAWDRGEDLKRQTSLASRSIRILNNGTDGGAAEDTGEGAATIPEGPAYNTIDYAKLCVQELGEIPFFKKIADGKYETFDCRDFVGSNGDQPGGPIEGVQSAVVPLTVDDQPQTECSEGRTSSRTYDCVDKCDRGMWLTASSHTGLGRKAACQPGVTVSSAKNEQGSHWVLLCRKVDNSNGESMMKTKVFNDIAIIGTNPQTGKTCFFQNKENVGNDGSRVVHPADVARSSAIWPATPSSYCTKNCHATDAFIHSPWIDQALRSDGHTIVPKMGELRDFPISNLELPYRLVNGPAQGFVVPQQLVSEQAAPCMTCHRVAGAAFAEFAEWSTGKGEAYFSKITDSYQAFEKSHWMPMRLDGLTAENFESSRWGLAVKHIRECTDDPSAPGCQFADIPQSP
jgi:hypothetical protein